MRYSQMLIPTVKEVPAEAEITSHKLMIRAGLIRKVASGTYTYLPLGWRTLKKIINIVREEMDRAGAQEIIVPCLQPLELWQQTGRDVDYGETMFRLMDRHGRGNVLGPTAEEVFTFHAAAELNSYKQLPVNLYQITPKFRDEFRPRFGVLRSREFIMKDAYSFDATPESLHKIVHGDVRRLLPRLQTLRRGRTSSSRPSPARWAAPARTSSPSPASPARTRLSTPPTAPTRRTWKRPRSIPCRRSRLAARSPLPRTCSHRMSARSRLSVASSRPGPRT